MPDRGGGGEVRRAVRRRARPTRDAPDARARVRRPAGHRFGAAHGRRARRAAAQQRGRDLRRRPLPRPDAAGRPRARGGLPQGPLPGPRRRVARGDRAPRRLPAPVGRPRWKRGSPRSGRTPRRVPGSPRRRSSSPSCRRRCPRSSSAGRSTDHAGDEVMSYVMRFAELGRGDIAVAGGKGANLGELTRAGLPVPPGFVLTTAAYRAFVEGVQEEVLALAAASDAAAIRALLTSRPIPDDMAREVTEAWSALGEVPVAVRSSATAEDLEGASFAGQQDTYLNVRGRRRAARRRARVLGVAVDRARRGLPRPAGDRPGRGRAGRRRAADGRGRRGRGDVHREPDQRPPRRGGAVRRVGARRVGGGRHGDHRRPRRREGGPAGGRRAPRPTRP